MVKIKDNTTEKALRKPLRMWPGIVLVIIQWALWYVIPKFESGGTAMSISVFGGLGCGLAVILWWAFFSKAPRFDRLLAVILMIALLVIMPRFTHKSIETGMSGVMYYIYAIPVLCLAFILWVIVSRKFSIKFQRLTMVIVIFLACGIWTLFKSEGITGNASAQLTWRWAISNEDKLLANDESTSMQFASMEESDILWPGFRGKNRDGIIHGLSIITDWKTSPPDELWRRPIGPGCSSFAVKGIYLYTQEQRGEDELVSCYNINTGELIWKHHDKARFWDSHAGAGPRSTPTLHDSLVITLGATGVLNVLNVHDGSVVWSRNAATDIKDTIPGWGYASSPLVVDSIVIIAVSGTLVAYDISTGEPRWYGPDGGENYSSPQLFTIEGRRQVLMMSAKGTTSFAPEDGTILWERSWNTGSIVQPAMTKNGDILISEGYKKGIHRITVSQEKNEWKIKEHWMTTKIRPDFNDFVLHKGHLYGFEGLSLTCIDLLDGSRKWKTGRYGGQVLLLADQDLLLVLSEKGELALVEADPEKLTELAKIQAIEGKTWNHPVLVDDMLVVRNTQEMAAFRLNLKSS